MPVLEGSARERERERERDKEREGKERQGERETRRERERERERERDDPWRSLALQGTRCQVGGFYCTRVNDVRFDVLRNALLAQASHCEAVWTHGRVSRLTAVIDGRTRSTMCTSLLS